MKALNKRTGQLEKVYVKALDSMPVGTVVEFNGQASDIPSGWEEVSDKSIMVSGISQNFTNTQTEAWIKLPNQVLQTSIGNKLLFANEAIKIGAGVRTVKIMGALQYQPSNGFVILEIVKESNGVQTRIGLAVGQANVENTITTCMNIVNVQENDMIYLKCNTYSQTVISADATRLYVEEV